jgi:2',3'-cyclic-nucleotide 2'-phosphodiesterase (5'-nucleotidase family)
MFSDEAGYNQRLDSELKAQGVDAVVVAIHQGLNNDGG